MRISKLKIMRISYVKMCTLVCLKPQNVGQFVIEPTKDLFADIIQLISYWAYKGFAVYFCCFNGFQLQKAAEHERKKI